MSSTTLCPTCNTRFKVSQLQLDAHQGLVRCGRCQAVFNATDYLQDDQPSPQLDLPIGPEVIRQPAVETLPVPATREEIAPGLDERTGAGQEHTDRQVIEQQEETEPAKLITGAQKITFADNPDALFSEPVKKKSAGPWIAGCLLLIIVLLAQAAYYFRTEIAASQPALKTALLSYCNLLQCTVPLPQNADLMSIEASDLEADPAQSGVIALNALLRNHAPHAQAYPQLELTLTDTQEKPLARRTFRPAEYLKPDEDEKQGLAANRELSVKLNLDTTDLKPSGYRLFLFYPR